MSPLPRDQFGRFHFVNSIEYKDVPLYCRISEYLVRRGCRELEKRKLGISARAGRVEKLLSKGLSVQAIALEVGCTERSLYNWLKRR